MQLRLQGISLKIKASLLPIFSNSRGSKYPEAARSRCTKLLYSSQCASFAGSSCPYALFFLSLLFNIFFPVDLVITVRGAERGKYTEGGSWQSRGAAREALLPSHDITCAAIGGTGRWGGTGRRPRARFRATEQRRGLSPASLFRCQPPGRARDIYKNSTVLYLASSEKKSLHSSSLGTRH